MEVLEPGHTYKVSNFEKPNNGQVIQFIHKEPIVEGQPELKTIADGTTTEELLLVLIDRTNFLNKKFPCRENSIAITKLDEALLWLNKRTEDRKKRKVEGKNEL
jgi:hypothetical protein